MAEDLIGLCGHVAWQRAANGSCNIDPNFLSGAQKVSKVSLRVLYTLLMKIFIKLILNLFFFP